MVVQHDAGQGGRRRQRGQSGVNSGSVASPPAGVVAPNGPIPQYPSGPGCAPGTPNEPRLGYITCGPIVPTPPVPLAPDLPSRDEARRIALDLLTATGMDVRGAGVTVDGPGEAWYVSVDPVVVGQPVVGLTATVSVGSKGAVTSASGFLARSERFGDYAELDTRATIDRLNHRTVTPALDDRAVTTTVLGTAPVPMIEPAQATGSGVTSAPGSSPASGPATSGGTTTCVAPPTAPGVAAPDHCVVDPSPPPPARLPQPVPPRPLPPQPVPPMPPRTVVLHQAMRVLVLVPASDGSGDAYLVPGYRFTGDGGAVVEQVAVDDASLVPARPVPMPAPAPAPMPTPAVGATKPQQ